MAKVNAKQVSGLASKAGAPKIPKAPKMPKAPKVKSPEELKKQAQAKAKARAKKLLKVVILLAVVALVAFIVYMVKFYGRQPHDALKPCIEYAYKNIDKDVAKEALENYVKTLEQTEQEEAEEKQGEKKMESIEDKTWLNFNAILAIYSYYEKALEDITKEPIPPCFNSICDPKYLKFALDGLEDAMAALTMLYKNILERSGTHGE